MSGAESSAVSDDACADVLSLSLSSQPREKGRMRFHRLQNVQIALDYLKRRQVRPVRKITNRVITFFYAPIPVLKLVYEHLNLKTFDITSVYVLCDF